MKKIIKKLREWWASKPSKNRYIDRYSCIVDAAKKRTERELKMEMLMLEIKGPALQTYLRLNHDGVQLHHEGRVIHISPAAMELSKEIGVDRIFGLKLKSVEEYKKTKNGN